MSRSVAPSLKQIVNRLRTVGDELAIDDAKAWLQSSASSDRVLEVIKLLELYSPHEETIEWCAEFLRTNPRHLETPGLWAIQSQSIFRLKYKTADPSDEDSLDTIEEVLEGVRSLKTIALAETWLDNYQQLEAAFAVVCSLLKAAPNKENFRRARKWLQSNSDKFGTNVVVSLLLQSDFQQNDVDYSLNELRQYPQSQSSADNGASYLAESILKYVSDESARAEALAWMKNELQGPWAEYAAMDFSMLTHPDLAQSIVQYLFDHPEQENCRFVWINLLIRNCTESLLAECWRWLEANPDFADWDWVFHYFLRKAGEYSCSISTAAMAKAREAFELSKQKNPSEAGLTLSSLLELAPNARVVISAKKHMHGGAKPKEYFHLLESLIRNTDDSWAACIARRQVALETKLGFRVYFAESFGALMLALIDTNKADDSIRTSAAEWLEYFGHEHIYLAGKLRERVT
jgi:hypothetical protein